MALQATQRGEAVHCLMHTTANRAATAKEAVFHKSGLTTWAELVRKLRLVLLS